MQENKKDKHEELPIEEFENDSQDIREEFLSKFNKKEEKPEEVKDDKGIEKAIIMFGMGLISKGVLSDIIKARSGTYKNTHENRKLGRVGQKYGAVSISDYGKEISREQYEKINQQIDDNKIKYEKVKEVFGGDTKLESISNICNFVGGSKIFKNIRSLYIEETQSGIEIALETADLSMERLYEGVDKVVHHISFQVNEKGKGLGADIFSKQITSYMDKGYKRIEAFATKNEISNGYYTWARLGFNFMKGSKEESMFSDLIKMSDTREVSSSKNLTDLMKTEEGRKFWKDFGFPFVGVFDLGKDSESIKTFNDYYNGKNKK